MVPLQDSAPIAPPAARGHYTATSGLEPGTWSGDRHQSVGGFHHAGCDHARVGLRTQPDCIADWFLRGGSATPTVVFAVHSTWRVPVSHAAATVQPTASRASQPSSRTPVSRHLAMGMAWASSMGAYGRDRNAIARHIFSTCSGADDEASSDTAALPPCCALGRLNIPPVGKLVNRHRYLHSSCTEVF
jgi:hypothetical protein